ncbi:MAG TPA: succinate dehydrogenase [Anaerolineae bacterium]|nr:succinate dehydrogenase [Anaerolineae bacterium]
MSNRTELSKFKFQGGFETWAWFFMRISGVVLLLIAVFHLLLMHVYIQVENITYDVVANRWTGAWGPFWRTYDVALLIFALTHGFNGLRWVVDDYIHRAGWNVFFKALLLVIYLTVIAMGAYTVFSFTG